MTIVDAAIVTAADDRRASDAAINTTTSNPPINAATSDAAIDATTSNAAAMETATKATAATKSTAATTTAAYGFRNGLSRSRRPTMRYRKRAGLNSREHWRREQRGTHDEKDEGPAATGDRGEASRDRAHVADQMQARVHRP